MENLISEKFKNIKKLFVELNFHHAYGYFIFNDNKDFRIDIIKTKSNIIIRFTKSKNIFKENDQLIIDTNDEFYLENVKFNIFKYFGFKSNDERYCYNCMYLKKLMCHPQNGNNKSLGWIEDKFKFGKGSIKEQLGWVCTLQFPDDSNKDKYVFFDNDNGVCESNTFKNI